jgi:hypothetical protein
MRKSRSKQNKERTVTFRPDHDNLKLLERLKSKRGVNWSFIINKALREHLSLKANL